MEESNTYESFSVEELEALIRKLRDLKLKKQGKSTLEELLNPDGDDFMGLGMSLSAFVATNGIRRFAASFDQQDKPERTRRLSFIVSLAAEYQKISQQTSFCTAFALHAIEAMVIGDWNWLKTSREMLAFDDEDGQLVDGRYKDIYVDFVKLLSKAIESIPADGSDEALV